MSPFLSCTTLVEGTWPGVPMWLSFSFVGIGQLFHLLFKEELSSLGILPDVHVKEDFFK